MYQMLWPNFFACSEKSLSLHHIVKKLHEIQVQFIKCVRFHLVWHGLSSKPTGTGLASGLLYVLNGTELQN